MNYRMKIISDNLNFCERFDYVLNDWETQFIKSIRDRVDYGGELSQKQFNRLQAVAQRVAKEVA